MKMMMQAILGAIAAIMMGAALAASPGGTGGGGGVVASNLPFPLIAGQMACYEAALASGQPIERYADWQSRSPAECNASWEDVPKDRRAHS